MTSHQNSWSAHRICEEAAKVARVALPLLLALYIGMAATQADPGSLEPKSTPGKVKELHFDFPSKRIGWLYEVKKECVWMRSTDAKELVEAKGHVVIKHDPETLALVLNNNALKDTSWISKIKPHSFSMLSLTQTKVEGPWIQNLKPMNWLTNIHFIKSTIDDDGLVYLKALPNLKILILDDNSLDGSGFKFVADSCPKLKILSANRCDVDGKYVNELVRLKELERLSIDEARIDNAQAMALTKIQTLTLLGLNSTKIEDSFVHAALNKLPKLTQLRVAYTPITTAAFRDIAKSRLVWLDLEGCELKGLQAPAFPNTLRILFLSLASGVDDAFLTRHKLPKLSQLMIARTKITGKGLELLANQTDLNFFIASSLDLTDADIKPLANMKKMMRLILKGNNITGNGLSFIVGMPDLIDLDLSYTKVGDEIIPYLKKCKKLEYVSLPNTNISKNGIDELRKFHPKCKFEHNMF